MGCQFRRASIRSIRSQLLFAFEKSEVSCFLADDADDDDADAVDDGVTCMHAIDYRRIVYHLPVPGRHTWVAGYGTLT